MSTPKWIVSIKSAEPGDNSGPVLVSDSPMVVDAVLRAVAEQFGATTTETTPRLVLAGHQGGGGRP